MMVFAAIYFYFLIQMLMTTKWKDSLTIQKMKETLNWVPSTVQEKTKIVKKKIKDWSVTIKKWVKKISNKTWEHIQKWKDFVVETYNDIKTKISDISTKVKGKWWKDISKTEINNDTISELTKTNKELLESNKKLIELSSQLIDKYDKNLKLLEEINKNLSKKK